MTRIELRPRAAAAAALLLLALAPAAARVADAAAAPKLVVEPATLNVGEVARDSVVEKTITLTNAGTAPLKIANIKSTGNTELSSRPTELAPGAKATITIRVPLLIERAGGILKQLEISSNDPARPVVYVDMKIESTEYVQPRPDKARWISVQQETDGTIRSVLSAPDGKPFRVLGHSTPPEGIDVVVQPIVPAEALAADGTVKAGTLALDPKGPHATWNVSMTLRKNAPIGAIVGQLEVQVDHDKQKVIPIPLSGFMRPVIAVTPHELVLDTVPAASARTHEFFVRNFATEGINITKVDSTVPAFGEGTIEIEEVGRRYKVKVPMDLSKTAPGAFKGIIRFHTDSPKIPFYSLPVSGTVTAP
jgi:hypothetical protein